MREMMETMLCANIGAQVRDVRDEERRFRSPLSDEREDEDESHLESFSSCDPSLVLLLLPHSRPSGSSRPSVRRCIAIRSSVCWLAACQHSLVPQSTLSPRPSGFFPLSSLSLLPVAGPAGRPVAGDGPLSRERGVCEQSKVRVKTLMTCWRSDGSDWL